MIESVSHDLRENIDVTFKRNIHEICFYRRMFNDKAKAQEEAMKQMYNQK